MKILLILILFSVNTFAKDVEPKKKYIYLFDKNYSPEKFIKNNYQVKRKAPKKVEMSFDEQDRILT